MSSHSNVEFSGWSGHGLMAEQARIKLRNAPAWVRERVAIAAGGSGLSPEAAPPRPAQEARRMAGWLFATCCPGVSIPARSKADGEELPEQFTPAAMESMLRQSRSGSRRIPITFDHSGPLIATTAGLDVVFRLHPLCGLELEARLPDTELGRRVIDQAVDGLGVSIGYASKRQWIVERDGVGRVRVVDDAVLHHVAILPRAAGRIPCFSAACCYGVKGTRMGCPPDVRERAELKAYRILKQQAGCR